MSGSIARYYASIGVSTDMAQLRKVDRYLTLVRKKMENFASGRGSGVTGKNRGGFTVTPQIKFDNKKAAAQINSQLGHISRSVVLNINRFKVDTSSLQRQVRAAILSAMQPIPVNFTRGRDAPRGGVGAGVAGAGAASQVPIPRTRSSGFFGGYLGGRASQQASPPPPVQQAPAPAPRAPRSGNNRYSYYPTSTRAEFLASTAMGAFGGSQFYRMGRLGGTFAVPALFGYGTSRMAKANQELMMQPLTHQAVFTSIGSTEEAGTRSFDWYKGLASDVGFSYSDNAQEFSSYMANAMGAGLDSDKSHGIYQGISEYMTAMGTVPHRRKLVLSALSQMLGKGTLSMEEVKINV